MVRPFRNWPCLPKTSRYSQISCRRRFTNQIPGGFLQAFTRVWMGRGQRVIDALREAGWPDRKKVLG